MEATCNTCGATFTASRSDARYCSPKCRVQAHRDRVNGAKPKRPRPPLGDGFKRVVWDLDKLSNRLADMANDDRMRTRRTREGIRAYHAGQLRTTIQRLQEVLDRLES